MSYSLCYISCFVGQWIILHWSPPASCLFLPSSLTRWTLMRYTHTSSLTNKCILYVEHVSEFFFAFVCTQVFMINLVRRTDRRDRMLRTLYELELSCKVVAAVDGKYVSHHLPPPLPASSSFVPLQHVVLTRAGKTAETNGPLKSSCLHAVSPRNFEAPSCNSLLSQFSL